MEEYASAGFTESKSNTPRAYTPRRLSEDNRPTNRTSNLSNRTSNLSEGVIEKLKTEKRDLEDVIALLK